MDESLYESALSRKVHHILTFHKDIHLLRYAIPSFQSRKCIQKSNLINVIIKLKLFLNSISNRINSMSLEFTWPALALFSKGNYSHVNILTLLIWKLLIRVHLQSLKYAKNTSQYKMTGIQFYNLKKRY